MSTQRGNALRTRAQKHKNRHVFKNDLHDTRPQQKKLNSLHISEVCLRCKQVIEWKIKYKKYKALSQPKICVKCQQRNIRKAYHVLCRDCALSQRVCAKCLKTADEVEIEPPAPSPEEELKLKVEMERLIKSFPERKRRSFLRYMKKGKVDVAENQEEGVVEDEENDLNAPKPVPRRTPHSRDDLLRKIEELKVVEENEFDSDDFSDSDDDEDNDLSGDDLSEDDEESDGKQ